MPATYEYITHADRLGGIANEIACAKNVELDLETTGFDPHTCKIRLCSLNIDEGRAIYVIDVFQTGGLGPVAQALHNPTEQTGAGRPLITGQNCLTAESRVWLADGSRVRLDRLVREKHPGPVWTRNETTGALEARSIVGWIKAPVRPWADWLRIQVRGKGCLRLTEDHVVLTTRGRVSARDVVVGDRIWSSLPALTPAQHALVYGSMLGDASLVMQTGSKARTPYFRVAHTEPQRPYLEFKARILGPLLKDVRRSPPATRGFGAAKGVVLSTARSRSDARLWGAWDACVVGGAKTLTSAWLAALSWPALALWYCDDGSLHGTGASFCVSKFGDHGISLLVSHLRGLGVPARIATRADGHRYLRIHGPRKSGLAPEMCRFWERLAPYVPPCMAYKLPERYRALASESFWTEPAPVTSWADEVIEVRPLARAPGDARRHGGVTPKGRGLAQYCLTVQGNPNFFAEGLAVSNCKFDQLFLLVHHGVELWPVFDTFRASSMVYNGLRELKHDLFSIYKRELNMAPQVGELGGSDWSRPVLTQEQLDYAADDVIHLPACRKALREKLKARGLLRVALIEFGAILPEAEVEKNGFRLDPEKWLALAETNRVKSDALAYELVRELPSPSGQLGLFGYDPKFNLDSPVQLLKSLGKLGFRLENTSEASLAPYAAVSPLIKKLIEYRGVSKSVASFGPDYLSNINPKTGRIHAGYFPMLVTGRYAHMHPNLGQIPRGKAFRSCFRPLEGRRLVICDWANIEMVIAAELSGDTNLIRLFNEGADVHKFTASRIAKVPESEVTKDQRQQAKPANFGFLYGMGAEKFVSYALTGYGIAFSVDQATEIRAAYFASFPGLKTWHRKALADGEKLGCARSIAGRLRWLQAEKDYSEFFNCVDAETEALTRRGWVRGFDLTLDDVLLTKNAETGALEWQGMTDLRLFPNATGRFVSLTSRSFNAVTTPNHRWLVYNARSRRNECRVTDALDLHGAHRIHRTGCYTGPAATHTDDFVALCGWFLTDASYYLKGRRKDRPVAVLSQSQRANPHKVAAIDALLSRLGCAAWRSKPAKRTQVVAWHLPVEWSLKLHALFPKRTLTDAFLASLSAPQAQTLFATMMLGDGTTEESGKRSYCAGSEARAGAFQALCVLCGLASTAKARDMSKYAPKSPKLLNVPKAGVVWYVNVLTRDKTQVLRRHRQDFEGVCSVWCPIVPNTYFVARRRGMVYITGNTPVQATGADGLKAALRCLYRRVRGTEMLMVHHVHDEALLEGPDDPEALKVGQHHLEEAMKEGMQPLLKRVPARADAGLAMTWADK